MPLRGTFTTLSEELRKTATAFPDRRAIADGNDVYSYGELDDRTDRLAEALQEELDEGAVVSVLMSNRAEWAEVLYGCFKAGMIPAGINHQFDDDKIVQSIDATGAEMVVFGDETATIVDRIESAVGAGRFVDVDGSYSLLRERNPPVDREGTATVTDIDSPALLWLTSGTTGTPKPVLHSNRSLVATGVVLAQSLGLDETDTSLLLMPFSHGNSQLFLVCALYLGGSVRVHRSHGFDPDEMLSLVESEGVTFTSLVPTHLNKLVSDGSVDEYDLSSLETLLSSSAPLPNSVKEATLDRFDCDVYEGYGAVEVPFPVVLQPHEQAENVGSVGKPLPGYEVAVLDREELTPVVPGKEGEIYVRGPGMMEGYYGRDEKTTEAVIERDGSTWISVGDIGRRDGSGYVYVVRRTDDVITSGGEDVVPTAVEDVLHAHDGVVDVAVVGVPDQTWGEAVHAVVVPDEVESPSADELEQFCRDRLSAHEVPKQFEFADDLPRSPTGKLERRQVQSRYWDGDPDYSKL